MPRLKGQLIAAACLVTLLPQPVRAASPSATWTPSAELRVRQERLENGFHWDAVQPTRDWIRVRARAGLRVVRGPHSLDLRLCDEFRKIRVPDTELDLDEVIVDRLAYVFAPGEGTSIAFGRLDLIRDDGFLLLDGGPWDGSRTAYQNALRIDFGKGALLEELAVIRNPKVDPFVLWSDRDERNLTDADETGAVMRFSLPDGTGATLIWKSESDPDHGRRDLRAWTLGLRQARRFEDGRQVAFEIALQRQDYPEWQGLRAHDGWAFALQARLGRRLPWAVDGELGYFHYSGESGGLMAFKTPWGRWPKWSELYIYTLIPESGVASWENTAAPHLTLKRGLRAGVDASFSMHWLLAPEPGWETRGALFTTGVKFAFGERLTGHLRWEALRPGAFHRADASRADRDVFGGSAPLPPLEKTAHFLRWQFSYSFL